MSLLFRENVVQKKASFWIFIATVGLVIIKEDFTLTGKVDNDGHSDDVDSV